MTRIIDEQLSALLDGELPCEQEEMLLRRLEREPESRDRLARYGLIGELLRNPSAGTAVLSISARVSTAIAAESSTDESAGGSSSPSSATFGYIGAGLAASIALLVVLNLADPGGAARLPDIDTTPQVAHADHVAGDNSGRLTRYLVSHAQFANGPSRQLMDSHITMAGVAPALWAGNE